MLIIINLKCYLIIKLSFECAKAIYIVFTRRWNNNSNVIDSFSILILQISFKNSNPKNFFSFLDSKAMAKFYRKRIDQLYADPEHSQKVTACSSNIGHYNYFIHIVRNF